MKKILIVLASLSVVACSRNVDCICDVYEEGTPYGYLLFAPDMKNCDNVSINDLDDVPAESTWINNGLDYDQILVCEENKF